jgi:RecB family endonuclease NucS
MRLVVARCEVHYSGRLTAVLPEAVRLLVFKADGSVLVHDDAGGYKPLNRIRSAFRPESTRWAS